MYSGVPKLTFPLVWDQFLNAKMIVDKERRGQGTDEKLLGSRVAGFEFKVLAWGWWRNQT
ncbi:hypothetical protein F2Q70_00000834 [Brassica cretica]|uniref:Uncharacterized protein n=1 Tax=Brassica cretica TaxID=69181 RepID=A0A8S9ILU3_BRACR|nr:hypothetical protein F2Q68_00027694 [Brassica cretica]KAF2570799.1 hypothetical protein F2Q70_00000834 [Brassica cretica]